MSKKESINNKVIVLCIIFSIILLCFLASLFNEKTTVQKLKEKGYKIYGSQNCGWCLEQLKVFNSEDVLDIFVDCSDPTNREECKNIKATPTWKRNNKTIYVGFLPKEEIIKLLI